MFRRFVIIVLLVSWAGISVCLRSSSKSSRASIMSCRYNTRAPSRLTSDGKYLNREGKRIPLYAIELSLHTQTPRRCSINLTQELDQLSAPSTLPNAGIRPILLFVRVVGNATWRAEVDFETPAVNVKNQSDILFYLDIAHVDIDIGNYMRLKRIFPIDQLVATKVTFLNISRTPGDVLKGVSALYLRDMSGFLDTQSQNCCQQLGQLTLWNSHMFSSTALHAFMPNLQHLVIEYSDLQEIPKSFPWSNSTYCIPKGLQRDHESNLQYAGNAIVPTNVFFRGIILTDAHLGNITDPLSGNLVGVTLKHSRVTWITEDLLWNVSTLQVFDASNNYLTSLPKDLFKFSFEMIKTNFSHNQLSVIPKYYFTHCRSLQDIDLSHNQIQVIEPKAFCCGDLRSLELGNNKITTFNDEHFEQSPDLENIELNNNCLSSFPVYVIMHRHLQQVDLRNNKIHITSMNELLDEFVVRAITVVHSVFVASEDKLRPIPGNIRLLMNGNNISSFHLSGNDDVTAGRRAFKLRLLFAIFRWVYTDPTLSCSCKLFSPIRLWERFDLIHLSKLRIITLDQLRLLPLAYNMSNFQVNDWKCSTPHLVAGKRIGDVPSDELYCEVSCNCTLLNMKCWKNSNGNIFVDCTNATRNMTSLPSTVPNGTVAMRISVLRLERLDYRYYLENLKVFSTNLTNVRSIKKDFFPGFGQLDLLDMTLADPNVIPESITNVNASRLILNDDHLQCKENNRWMRDWLRRLNTETTVPDPYSLKCKTKCAGSGSELKRVVFTESEDYACPLPLKSKIQRDQTRLIASTSSVAALLALTIIFVAVIYVYRLEIKVLLYHKFNLHPFDRTEDDVTPRYFDAFLTYNRNDSKFARECIMESLQEKGYRLCVHERDFEHTEGLVGKCRSTNHRPSVGHPRIEIGLVTCSRKRALPQPSSQLY